MSPTYDEFTNIKKGYSKIHYLEYPVRNDELRDESLYNEASIELDADLIWNNYYQKMKLRRAARRLRHVSYS
jgi:hypothetical protein